MKIGIVLYPTFGGSGVVATELRDGFNVMDDGEEIFYISNPALGLWAFKDRFNY